MFSAYFIGSAMGKHKLCPNISPKKSVEGAVGGVIISVLCTAAACLIFQYWIFPEGVKIHYFAVILMSLAGWPLYSRRFELLAGKKEAAILRISAMSCRDTAGFWTVLTASSLWCPWFILLLPCIRSSPFNCLAAILG